MEKLGIKKIWTAYKVYILSSLIVLGVILSVLCFKGFWPFGDKIFMNGDYIYESWPFMMEMKHKLAAGESLAYTWNAGFGASFAGMIPAGFTNPYMYLYLLLPEEAFLPASTVVFILNEIAINCAMLFYLIHRPGRHLEQSDFSNMMFSISFTMCMYLVSNINNWHLMANIVYCPLILLGLEYAVYNNGWKLYYISLTASLLCGYYMTFMFCMFIFLYYMTLEFQSFKNFVRMGFKILGLSILAFLSSMEALLPGVLQLLQNSYTISSYQEDTNVFFGSFFNLFQYFLAFNEPIDRGMEATSYGEANLYCGLMAVILMTTYFFCKDIKWNVRIRKFAVVLFYMAAFNTNKLNYFMHMLHYPSWFPNRFSIFFTLLCIIIAYEIWTIIKEKRFRAFPYRWILLSGIGWIILTILCFVFVDTVKYPFVFTYSIAIIGIYLAVFLMLYLFGRKLEKVLICMVCLELSLCFAYTLIYKGALASYTDLNKRVADVNLFLEEHGVAEHNGFSRINEGSALLISNGGFINNMKGVTLFTSGIPDTRKFLGTMGIAYGGNYVYGYTYTKPVMSMLNVQYVCLDKNEMDYSRSTLHSSNEDVYNGLELYAEKDDYMLYENDTVLALGYMIPYEAKDAFADLVTEDEGRVETGFVGIQNKWIRGVTGIDNVMVTEDPGLVLQKVESENCDVIIYNGGYVAAKKFSTESLRGIDLDMEGLFSDFADGSTDGEDDSEGIVFRLYYQAEQDGNYYVQIGEELTATGYLKKGETVSISYGLEEYLREDDHAMGDIIVSRLDEERWQEAYHLLSGNQMEVTNFTSTELDGEIDVKEDGLLFTSIPYDSNWHIYIDGQEEEVYTLWNRYFIVMDLREGYHHIHMEYKQKGVVIGWIFTILTILSMSVVMIMERKQGKQFFQNP